MENVFKVEFDRLSDLLYTAMQADKPVTSVILYKDEIWKMWYWPESNWLQVMKSTEVVTWDIIEFDIPTGKFKKVAKMELSPRKHYFIVTKPTYVQILDDLIEEGWK